MRTKLQIIINMKDSLLKEIANKVLVEDQHPSKLPELKEYYLSDNYPQCRRLIRLVKEVLRHPSPVKHKLRALNLLSYCMQTPSNSFLYYTTKNLLGVLQSYAEYTLQCMPHQDIFGAVDSEDKQVSAEFLETLLWKLKEWAFKFGVNGKGQVNDFYLVYDELLKKGVNFETQHSAECCALAEEIRKGITENWFSYQEVKDKAKSLRKMKCELEEKIDATAQETYLSELLITHEKVLEALKLFEEWKQPNHFKRKEKHFQTAPPSVSSFVSEKPQKVAEPVAKPEVVCNPNTSMEESIGEVSEGLKRPSGVSESKERLLHDKEYIELKEQLEENQDLLHLYKEDLKKMQMNYLRSNEEKEEIKMNLNETNLLRQQLENQLSSCKEEVNSMKVTVHAMNEEIQAFKLQNECLRESVREFRNRNDQLEFEVQNLNQCIKDLKSSEEEKKAKLKYMEREYSKYKNKYKELKNQNFLRNLTRANSAKLHSKEVVARQKSQKVCYKIKGDDSVSDSQDSDLENPTKFSFLDWEAKIDFEDLEKPYQEEPCIECMNTEYIKTWKKQGVLFEDGTIQVGFKLETKSNTAKGTMYIGNKSRSELHKVATTVCSVEGLCAGVDPEEDTYPLTSFSQTSRFVLFKVESAFWGSPVLELSFKVGSRNYYYPLALPLGIWDFLVKPFKISALPFQFKSEIEVSKKLDQVLEDLKQLNFSVVHCSKSSAELNCQFLESLVLLKISTEKNPKLEISAEDYRTGQTLQDSLKKLIS